MWRSVIVGLAFLSLAAGVAVDSSHQDAEVDLLAPLKTTAQRIIEHGYPAETHVVTTEDGYMLTVFRIPYSPRTNNQNVPNKRAVLLLHGLMSCSDQFVLAGPDDGLAFILADEGYDVWMGNARGNIYSRQHIIHSPNFGSSFWAFNLLEMAKYDVKATVGYILNLNGQTSLHCMGMSQGATLCFYAPAVYPALNNNLRTTTLFAGPVYKGNVSSALAVATAQLLGYPNTPLPLALANKEFLPYNPWIQRILDTLCNGNASPGLCIILHLLGGGNSENIDASMIPLILETHPAGCATNQLIHTGQLHISREVRAFDYGFIGNWVRYGQSTPPDFALEQVTVPVYLYLGTEDDSAPESDGRRLQDRVPHVEITIIDGFGHTDFAFHRDLKVRVYDPAIAACKAYDAIHTTP